MGSYCANKECIWCGDSEAVGDMGRVECSGSVGECRDDDFFTLRAPPSLSRETLARGENEVVYSHKIMTIIMRSHHPILRLLGNLLLCESLG